MPGAAIRVPYLSDAPIDVYEWQVAAQQQRRMAMSYFIAQQHAHAHASNMSADLAAAAAAAPPGFVPAMASDGSVIFVDARFIPGMY